MPHPGPARVGAGAHHSGAIECATGGRLHFPGDDLFTPGERRKGLPIGNLTSQFWANVFFDPFDHFMGDELGTAGYVRYVDDFLIFRRDKD